MIKKLVRAAVVLIVVGFLAGYGQEILDGFSRLKSIAEEKLEGHTWQSVVEGIKEWWDAAEETFDSVAKDVMDAPAGETSDGTFLIPAVSIRVVDGDTIVVSTEGEVRKVRLIGINAEESVHEDETRNNCYGQAASDYLKGILREGTPLWLEYDEVRNDIYGRELCYVRLSDSTVDISNMLNAILLSEGYAYTSAYAPNVRYSDIFAGIQAKATADSRGLWIYDDFRNAAGL